MRVLITGSTTWHKQQSIKNLLQTLPADAVIVTGDTPGADAISITLAQQMGLKVESMKKEAVDYASHPKAAWQGLNHRMVATGIDLVCAFHAEYGQPGKARGTLHAVEAAQASGAEVRIFTK